VALPSDGLDSFPDSFSGDFSASLSDCSSGFDCVLTAVGDIVGFDVLVTLLSSLSAAVSFFDPKY
jgi:hypothetical protein